MCSSRWPIFEACLSVKDTAGIRHEWRSQPNDTAFPESLVLSLPCRPGKYCLMRVPIVFCAPQAVELFTTSLSEKVATPSSRSTMPVAADIARPR